MSDETSQLKEEVKALREQVEKLRLENAERARGRGQGLRWASSSMWALPRAKWATRSSSPVIGSSSADETDSENYCGEFELDACDRSAPDNGDSFCDDSDPCTTDSCTPEWSCSNISNCLTDDCPTEFRTCPGPDGYVTPKMAAAITQQIVNLDDTAEVEITTLSCMPNLLTFREFVLPGGGLSVASEGERMDRRSCEPGSDRCRQRFLLTLDTSQVCQLDGDYELVLDWSCAPGADCDLFDPGLGREVIEFTLNSENFCD